MRVTAEYSFRCPTVGHLVLDTPISAATKATLIIRVRARRLSFAVNGGAVQTMSRLAGFDNPGDTESATW